MNKVGIFNETKMEVKEVEEIKKLLFYAIKTEKVCKLEFNVILVDNQTIKELNRDYRGIDDYTDVISFALEDNGEVPNVDYRILGDIYISLDKCQEQAKKYGHSFKRELAFLSVHGFLHLLGYDHMNKEEEEIMFSKQEYILNSFGITR